jgi:tellurite resistance protein TerC
MPTVHAAALAAANADFADIHVPTWAWVGFVALLAGLLAVDLLIHRGDHAPTARRALVESGAWIACGVGFSVVVLAAWGGQAFGEYLSGYVIEKSLSIDNVFVWAIIFSTFAIPARYQHRVLFWGIFGALTLRAVFIFGGSALITRFWWMLPVFGLVLLVSGVKVIRHRDDEGTQGHDRAVKLLGRFVPVRETLSGQRFVLRERGKWVATPLLAALVVIEVTDVVFAIDSVPAILAVSREPFLVFASNAFAILGLRAMYFLLGDARDRFHYLSHALGAILVFVGVKMGVSHWYHMPTALSLAVILAILASAIALSVRKQRLTPSPTPPAHGAGGSSGSPSASGSDR